MYPAYQKYTILAPHYRQMLYNGFPPERRADKWLNVGGGKALKTLLLGSLYFFGISGGGATAPKPPSPPLPSMILYGLIVWPKLAETFFLENDSEHHYCDINCAYCVHRHNINFCQIVNWSLVIWFMFQLMRREHFSSTILFHCSLKD